MKILIIDDELVSRKKMEKIMSQIGEIDAAENGTDGIEKFTTAFETDSRYDLITLDIMMPDMNGLEVLTAIRKIEKDNKISHKKQVKIIMVTSTAEQGIVVDSVKAGCNNYVLKPFNRESVFRKLKTVGFKDIVV